MRARKGPWWMAELRNQGLRVTEPRQAVLNVMQKMSGHHSADEIFFSSPQALSWDRTGYNLSHSGFVNQIRLG
jgi:hypothetical protein